jgi:hypothetical protein
VAVLRVPHVLSRADLQRPTRRSPTTARFPPDEDRASFPPEPDTSPVLPPVDVRPPDPPASRFAEPHAESSDANSTVDHTSRGDDLEPSRARNGLSRMDFLQTTAGCSREVRHGREGGGRVLPITRRAVAGTG